MRRLSQILITAGPTRERLDDIRFISNFSTGRMGYELAEAALERRYKVTLISGPTEITPPKGVNFIPVESTIEMGRAVRKALKKADCLFMASAVCDWRPETARRGKIKKASGPTGRKARRGFSLKLVQNPDILLDAGRHKGDRLLVGFALESKDLIKNAKEKLKRKNLDLIVANRIGKGRSPFGPGKTDAAIIDRRGNLEKVSAITKRELAEILLNKAELLWQKRP